MRHSRAQTTRWSAILSFLVVIAPSPSIAESYFWPNAAQWSEAARDALTDPYTWVPTAGAAVTGLTGLDHTISSWAVEETPLFGSPDNAEDASDYLRTATYAGMLASAVAVPEPWSATFKRILVEHAAVVTTAATTNFLKGSTDRLRPDESDRQSFPSGHSSQAFTYAAMGSMNIETLPLQEPAQTGLHLGLTGVAAATAWARVEGGVHFPSDVLFGAALGNFIGHFLQEAFLGEQENLQVELYMGPDAGFLEVSLGLQ
jgi:membrane-associated phospholipid phosphatase